MYFDCWNIYFQFKLIHRVSYELRGSDTRASFSAICINGDSKYDYMFSFMHAKALLKRDLLLHPMEDFSLK